MTASDLVQKFWEHLGIAREDFQGPEVESQADFIHELLSVFNFISLINNF